MGAYFDFFEDVQKKLRAKGKRVYGLGYSLATKDFDSDNLFNQFLVAYGGAGIVTPDGKLHVDDPKVRKAAIKALDQARHAYKEGYRAARRDQLGRSGQQQRLPCQADRDDAERDDLDRGRADGEEPSSTTRRS